MPLPTTIRPVHHVLDASVMPHGAWRCTSDPSDPSAQEEAAHILREGGNIVVDSAGFDDGFGGSNPMRSFFFAIFGFAIPVANYMFPEPNRVVQMVGSSFAAFVVFAVVTFRTSQVRRGDR